MNTCQYDANHVKKEWLITEFKANFTEIGFLCLEKISFLEKLLSKRKDVEETDEIVYVELQDFDPNQSRCHYNGEAYKDYEHHPRGGVLCQLNCSSVLKLGEE